MCIIAEYCTLCSISVQGGGVMMITKDRDATAFRAKDKYRAIASLAKS